MLMLMLYWFQIRSQFIDRGAGIKKHSYFKIPSNLAKQVSLTLFNKTKMQKILML